MLQHLARPEARSRTSRANMHTHQADVGPRTAAANRATCCSSASSAAVKVSRFSARHDELRLRPGDHLVSAAAARSRIHAASSGGSAGASAAKLSKVESVRIARATVSIVIP
jgi:hypothetical protein